MAGPLDPLCMTYCSACRSRVIHETGRTEVTCGLCGTTLDATAPTQSPKRFARVQETGVVPAPSESPAAAG